MLLTKDNLVKRKWKGCTEYCFCDSNETVQHLFISCPFVRIIWCMVYFMYNLPPPTNITNMFDNWLNGIPKNARARIRIVVSALCWSIWTCRNNIIFHNQKDSIFCKLFVWLRHGFIYGPNSSSWISGNLWLLDATGC
jgi:hypothetical protein